MKVVISGSFKKHLSQIMFLLEELESKNIEVLNPTKEEVIKNQDNPNFILFKGQIGKSELELELEYLESIAECNAHIVCDVDGYLGEMSGNELLYACSMGIPVYLTEPIKNVYTSSEPQSTVMKKIIINYIDNGAIKIGLEELYCMSTNKVLQLQKN